LPGYKVLILRELFLPGGIILAKLFLPCPCLSFGRALVHPCTIKIQRTGLTFQTFRPNRGPSESLSPKPPCQKPSPTNTQLSGAAAGRKSHGRSACVRLIPEMTLRRPAGQLECLQGWNLFHLTTEIVLQGLARFRDFSLQFTTRSDELRICWRKSCAWRNCLIARSAWPYT